MFILNGGVGIWFIAESGFCDLRDHLGRLLDLDMWWWNPFSLNQVWDIVSTDHGDVFYY